MIFPADVGPLETAAFKLVGEAAKLDSEIIEQYLSPGLLKEIYKIAEERAKNGVDWENEEDGEGKMIIIDKDGEQIMVVLMCASGEHTDWQINFFRSYCGWPLPSDDL
jgi:hypothetical protein